MFSGNVSQNEENLGASHLTLIPANSVPLKGPLQLSLPLLTRLSSEVWFPEWPWLISASRAGIRKTLKGSKESCWPQSTCAWINHVFSYSVSHKPFSRSEGELRNTAGGAIPSLLTLGFCLICAFLSFGNDVFWSSFQVNFKLQRGWKEVQSYFFTLSSDFLPSSGLQG